MVPEFCTSSSEQVWSYSQFVVSIRVSVDIIGGLIDGSGGSDVRGASMNGIAFVLILS